MPKKIKELCQNTLGLIMHETSSPSPYEIPCTSPITRFSSEWLSHVQLTIPCVTGAIHNLVPFDYTICSGERGRDPWNSDGLRGECGACGILWRLLRNSFSGVLTCLLWHRAWTDFIKCLYHYRILGVCPVTQNIWFRTTRHYTLCMYVENYQTNARFKIIT